MRNTAKVGNAAELKTARLLEQLGWVVGSRRHIGGAGDLLAVKLGCAPRVIEVKCRKHLWEGFRQPDREALSMTAASIGGVAEVAWWKPGAGKPLWVPEVRWPVSRAQEVALSSGRSDTFMGSWEQDSGHGAHWGRF